MLVVLVVESNQSQLQPGLTSAQTSDPPPCLLLSRLDWTPYWSRSGLDISDLNDLKWYGWPGTLSDLLFEWSR